jgi:hypothetical protein
MTTAAVAFSEKVYSEFNARAAVVEAARRSVGTKQSVMGFYFVMQCYSEAGVFGCDQDLVPKLSEYFAKAMKGLREVRVPQEGDIVTWRFPRCCGIVIDWPRKIIMASRDGIVNMVPKLNSSYHHRFFSPW